MCKFFAQRTTDRTTYGYTHVVHVVIYVVEFKNLIIDSHQDVLVANEIQT